TRQENASGEVDEDRIDALLRQRGMNF
ncbi:MAG: hypothetical protein QOH19_830, partial [Actinomycetota bacterium]|nr:hypothetical protein [Actinomycetota bacterium]